jgi:hypothetical protein
MWPITDGSSSDPRVADQEPAGGDVAAWRERRLVQAGFRPDLAASLAHQRAIDLHALIELVDRGCPPDLAARILAPLDHEVTPC